MKLQRWPRHAATLTGSRGTTPSTIAISLTETLVSLLCFIMIGGTFMTLFVAVLSGGATTAHLTTTSTDAANAIGVVTQALREARRFELMDGGSYGTTYDATDNGGNIVAVTGLHIVFPATIPSVSVTTTSAGGGVIAMNGANSLVSADTDGATLDVYRSDASGNPSPNTGTCLWIKGTLNGAAIPGSGQALVSDIAPTVGAVQFIQPYQPGTNTPLTNQVEIKIMTSAYDYAKGRTSSEQVKGSAVTALTGEHTFLRNHDPNGAVSGAAHGKTQYVGP